MNLRMYLMDDIFSLAAFPKEEAVAGYCWSRVRVGMWRSGGEESFASTSVAAVMRGIDERCTAVNGEVRDTVGMV